jgi:iron complex outermembrane receptor protein
MRTTLGVHAWVVFGLLALHGPPAGARETAASPPGSGALADLPLEDLLEVQVTSVVRGQRALSDTAAAVFVITREEIRRSGATSVPEALRLAPGLEVAQINSGAWAVTSRGFNARSANKILVLLDGRTLYTPLFSGVFWDMHGTVLDDVDRIEVIRGPGASVWGANAVNGVINIITRSTQETQGSLVQAIAGNEERGFLEFRHGGSRHTGMTWRMFAQGFERDPFLRENGAEAEDDWDQVRGGFRLDWKPRPADAFMVEGELSAGSLGQSQDFTSLSMPYTETRDVEVDSKVANVLGRWIHATPSGTEHEAQLYLDAYDRDMVFLVERRLTFDAEYRLRRRTGPRQEIIWGAGTRVSRDSIDNSFTASFDPDRRTAPLYSAFVEDLVQSGDGRWQFTFGTKLEHNDYTGFEVQPTARVLRRLGKRGSAWGAVSRAVRTPSRAEEDVRFNVSAFDPGGGLFVVSVFGNRDIEAEALIAYEAGFRTQATDRLSLDVALFYNDYRDLVTGETGTPFPEGSHTVQPIRFDNLAEGHSYGVEIAATWRPVARWRLSGWYSYFHLTIRPDPSSTDAETEEGVSPKHQAHLLSSLDLGARLSLDAMLRFVDELPALGVPHYLRADLRLTWRPRPGLEIGAGVQNLQDRSHPEFIQDTDFADGSLIERAWDARLRWRF